MVEITCMGWETSENGSVRRRSDTDAFNQPTAYVKNEEEEVGGACPPSYSEHVINGLGAGTCVFVGQKTVNLKNEMKTLMSLHKDNINRKVPMYIKLLSVLSDLVFLLTASKPQEGGRTVEEKQCVPGWQS